MAALGLLPAIRETASGATLSSPGVLWYCMDAHARSRDHAHMPLDLTDTDLETAAKACRAMAYQEGERAKQMENPGMRAPIENTAGRYAALAEKFERARERA
jgi:hypothetical protein